MAKLDVLKTIEKTRGHIVNRYDVYPQDLMKVMETAGELEKEAPYDKIVDTSIAQDVIDENK